MTTSEHMFAKYGSYVHSVENGNAVNLVRMELVPRYTARNFKFSTMVRLHIRGEILADTQADITDKIKDLAYAYAVNGNDWIYYQANGTPTTHRLIQDHPDALSDVQVEDRQWPVGDPAEYATGRVFSIVMRQTFLDVESEIMEYWEQIRYRGTGGPRRVIVNYPIFGPTIQLINSYTGVTCVQQGKVVGLEGWPESYVPGSVFPDYLTETDINYIEPQFNGKRYLGYGIEWTYTHVLPNFWQRDPSTPYIIPPTPRPMYIQPNGTIA